MNFMLEMPPITFWNTVVHKLSTLFSPSCLFMLSGEFVNNHNQKLGHETH